MGKKRKQALESAAAIDPAIWAEMYLPAQEQESLQKVLHTEMPASIRINCLKKDPPKMIATLAERYGWETERVPFCESGFWIRTGGKTPSSTIEHRLGEYYIQEAASMLPAELFDFHGVEKPLILDMAASPGGKTIHLIDRTADLGLVVANDASRSRIPALRIVLENWGAINQAVTCQQGEWFGYALPETFDAVLLDAPCSMQGLRISASHKARPITANEIASLAERQVNLVMSALQCVKTGGEVVYSTCTLSPQENEGVISEVIKRCGRAVEIADITEKLTRPAPGIGHIGDTILENGLQRSARLWPHIFNTAGFFSAKLTKNHALDARPAMQAEMRPESARRVTESETTVIFHAVEAQYGLEMKRIAEEGSLCVMESGGTLLLAPQRLQEIAQYLPLVSFGIPLGKALPDGWQPSHTLVSRFGNRFTRQIFTLEDEHLERWTRGEDIRGASDPSIPPGSVVAVRDKAGRNLGRGKMLKDRLKNQLPTRLF
jgi:16S rRNA (cytosine1407-C5)-methyltransferase